MKQFAAVAFMAIMLVAVATVECKSSPYTFRRLTDQLALKFGSLPAEKVAPLKVPAESVFDLSYSGVVLGLQRCRSSDPWTIHGLWAANNYCGGDPFSKSQVNDLWSQFETYWPTCSWSGNTEQQFLSHEWTKHGVCFNLTEHAYFSETLQIFFDGSWKSQCDQESSNSCDVQVSVNMTASQ